MHTSEANALSAWVVIASDLAEGATLEASELPERGLAALVLVSNRSGCSIDWLYRRLGITQSGAVRLVDRLAANGLMVRERTPGRHEVALHLTDAGEARLRQGLRARATTLKALVASLTPREQSQLVKLIAKSLAQGRRRREEADVACRLCDWDACQPACPLDASVVEGSAAGDGGEG